MVAAASPLERFRQALLACHQLYRDGGDHPELPVTAPAATALDRRLEELYQGLVVKIWLGATEFAIASPDASTGRPSTGPLTNLVARLKCRHCGTARRIDWAAVDWPD